MFCYINMTISTDWKIPVSQSETFIKMVTVESTTTLHLLRPGIHRLFKCSYHIQTRATDIEMYA